MNMEEGIISSDASSTSGTQAAGTKTEHIYYEVGSDVLDKSNALCALLEIESSPLTIVYCNNRSDQDLVEAVLRKRGFNLLRVGFGLPPAAVRETTRKLKSGEVSIALVTDDFSHEIKYDHSGTVINFSIPDDPELYSARMGDFASPIRPAKVISIIAPLDFSNFHYIKKVHEGEFVKGELPTRESVAKMRLEKLAEQAIKEDYTQDAALRSTTDFIMAHANRERIIAYLAHNTLNVMPSLKRADSSESRGGERSMSSDDDRGDRGGRFDRRDRRGGGRDRGDRGGRDDRGGRGGRRDRRGRDNWGEERRDDGDEMRMRDNGNGDERGERQERGDRPERSERGDRRGGWGQRREQLPPPAKEIRFYIGHGRKDGFDQEKFAGILEAQGLSREQLKRFSLREVYAFADVPEENAEGLEEKLANVEVSGGKRLFIKRATSINTPRPQSDEGGENGERYDDSGTESNGDGGSDYNGDDNGAEMSGSDDEAREY